MRKLEGMNWVCPIAPDQEPEKACPLDMALLQNEQRRDELILVKAVAIARKGEARDRAEHVLVAHGRTKIALHAPNARNHRRINREVRLQPVEGRGAPLHGLAAKPDARR